MFKVGDKVICINNNVEWIHLTTDKEYTITHVGDDLVGLINDIGNEYLYHPSRFKLKEPVEFQVGDIVEFGGVEGKVSIVDDEWNRTYPLRVDFKEDIYYYFTKDGKYNILHTKPLLNLVSRPKKKEKRLVKTTVQYSPSLGRVLRETEGFNDSISVELEKEIEVEV